MVSNYDEERDEIGESTAEVDPITDVSMVKGFAAKGVNIL